MWSVESNSLPCSDRFFLLNIKMHVTQLLSNARSLLNQGLPNKFLGKD